MRPVVAREQEWSALETFFGDATAGPRALVIEGAAGIGNSTLWLQAVDAACDLGFVVLSSRPAEASGSSPT